VRDNQVVQGAFATVVFVVSAVGVIGAVVGLLLNRRTWDQYGKNHMLLDSELPQARPSSSADLVERDEEVRQMLEARNARRRRRGEAEIDVERELARLTAPALDAELREEIRELVIARNHRRARRGEPALDVEAEIERQIAELSL
jgi:divalent metal cation (Fe/Co/Zn/Cd) transporter